MSKVFENTSSRIVIYSDNGAFKLIARRQAISEEHQKERKYLCAVSIYNWIEVRCKEKTGNYRNA